MKTGFGHKINVKFIDPGRITNAKLARPDPAQINYVEQMI